MKVTGITKQELEKCIAHFEKFAKTYFWTTPTSASGRRAEEKRNSAQWEFTVDDVPVIASVEITCSCKNYYASRTVKVGEEYKKMMVPFLKKVLKNMEGK